VDRVVTYGRINVLVAIVFGCARKSIAKVYIDHRTALRCRGPFVFVVESVGGSLVNTGQLYT
jgi:hypothetical protein